MQKSYYFQHDYTASSDTKILFLRQQLGMEGYGIYWFVIEQLAIAGGKMPMKIIPVLAMQMQTTETKVRGVIEQFDLFEITDNEFFSRRLNQHLGIRQQLSQAGRNGALNRWANREANGLAIGEANGHPNAKESKERKGKKVNESKERKESKYPDVAQVIEYFKENGYSQKAGERAYRYYNDAGWVDSHGKKVRNWKQKMQAVWFKDENLAVEEAKFISLNDLENAIKDIEQSQLSHAR